MRKVLLIILLSSFWACDDPYRKASEYHHRMAESQAELMTQIFDLSRNLPAMDSVEARNQLKATDEMAIELVTSIKEMPAFHTDTMLRFATLRVMNAYTEVLRTDLEEMTVLVSTGQLTDSTGQLQAMAIRRSILKKLMNAEKEFARQEGNFRRTFMAGKDMVEADTTFFGHDTLNPSEL